MIGSIVVSKVNVYVFPTGRRLYTGQTVEKRAWKRAVKKVAVHAARLAAHDRKTLAMEIKRRTAGGGSYGAETVGLDNKLDRCLGGLDGHLDAQERMYGSDDERGRAAARLRQAAFPEGVAAITRLPYVQQCVAVDALLDRVADPALAEDFATQSEMTPAIERVRALNELYRASIESYERDVPTAEEVRAAQARGQELLAELLVLILAHYIADAPDDHEGLADLIEPIQRQNEAIRLSRLRRRAPVDVDPDTGVELDDEQLPVLGADAPAAPAVATA